jgi:chemotaxis protein CheC
VGLGLVPTAPELIMDMAGAIVDYILIELSCKSEFALLVESEFTEPTARVKGHFFLIPNPEGLDLILKSIG